MEKAHESQIAQLQEQVEALNEKVSTLEDSRKDQLSMAVVSGDFDKILATMVISIAAAALDTKEEMIDYPHLSYAGAATFVCDANESSTQLFI